jgi:hypothetical protein
MCDSAPGERLPGVYVDGANSDSDADDGFVEAHADGQCSNQPAHQRAYMEKSKIKSGGLIDLCMNGNQVQRQRKATQRLYDRGAWLFTTKQLAAQHGAGHGVQQGGCNAGQCCIHDATIPCFGSRMKKVAMAAETSRQCGTRGENFEGNGPLCLLPSLLGA